MTSREWVKRYCVVNCKPGRARITLGACKRQLRKAKKMHFDRRHVDLREYEAHELALAMCSRCRKWKYGKAHQSRAISQNVSASGFGAGLGDLPLEEHSIGGVW